MRAILMFRQEVMDSHRTVSTNHNLFEEKGEPKWYRTEVLPLTNLTPNRLAKPAHKSDKVPPLPPPFLQSRSFNVGINLVALLLTFSMATIFLIVETILYYRTWSNFN